MDMLILIGLQASGKSTFYRTHFLATHAYVSKDLLRNNKHPARRQQLLIEEALQSGRSVVIDNTNPTREDRASLIALGHLYNAEVIGYYFETQVKRSIERNNLRAGKERVPPVAIFATLKKLVAPAYEEGFDQLYYVLSRDNFEFTLLRQNREGADGPIVQ
jgi:predicted kinase